MSRSFGHSFLMIFLSVFACWTLFSYAIIFSGSGFADLKAWSFAPVIIGLAIAALCSDNGVTASGKRLENRAEPPSLSESWWRTIRVILGISIVSLVLRLVDAPYWSVWIVLLSCALLVFRSSSIPIFEHSDPLMSESTIQRVGISALVVFGAILVAITHRPDPDDAQYLNFVVTAMDFPFDPIYANSGLWQDRSAPMELPIYRLHAYELLVATVSDVFDVEHKMIYYIVMPPMFGALAVLVHWRLAQHLVPQYAMATVVVWLVLILALGQSHREFGNFAFVRLFQGKAVLVTVIIPLCLLLGLRFAELPDWRRALSLFVAVIASLGMSSSALVATPFVVAAAVAGGLIGVPRASSRLIIFGGIASLAVLVAVGTRLLRTMNADGHVPYQGAALGADVGLSTVLGEGVLGAIILALFPLAPLFVQNAERRRLYAITTMFLVVFVLNPWTAPLLSENLDSALLWRLFWSVPFLLSASISLAALTVLVTVRLPWAARPAVLPIVLCSVLLFSSGLSISPDNDVSIGFPRYKVPPVSHELAQEIVRDAPPRSTIYAPIEIAKLITTFRMHPYPLLVRIEYSGFERTRSHFGNPELERRRRVIAILEGVDNKPSSTEFFRMQLANDRPTMVAYATEVGGASMIEASLIAAGYVGEKRGLYWLWRR
jgi:Family of unknown function (DUF6077)